MKAPGKKQDTSILLELQAIRALLEQLVLQAQTPFEDVSDDDLYVDVRRVVIEMGKASVSFLQRKFEIGYARASGFMDRLEEDGIISAANGSQPRRVLATKRLSPAVLKTLGEIESQLKKKKKQK